MKKLFLLAFLTAYGLCTAQSNKEASLKMRYKPQTEYTITQSSSLDMVLTYVASQDILDKLKNQGVENPTIKKQASENVIRITTGSLTRQNEYPVTLSFISSNNDALDELVQWGAVVHGRGTLDGLPVFDSISNTKLSKEIQDVFLGAMQSVISQIKYPEQNIKVGESASLDTPFNIPLGPVVINMNINNKYTLKAIKGNIAEYDIDVVFTFTSSIEGYTMLGGGDGGGKMSFDTSTGYYKSYNIDMNVDLSLDMGEMEIKLKMKQETDAKAEVKKK